MRFFSGTEIRKWILFILGGGLNTLFSYIVYYLLIAHIYYQYAFFISYIAGIFFSYIFNTCIVFRVPLSIIKFLKFPAVYIVQYSVSAILLKQVIEKIGVSITFAPIIVAIFMIPLTYVLTRFILVKKI